MHVLVIPSWYPTSYTPVTGVFFRDQVHALSKHGIDVGVIFPDLRSLKSIHLGKIQDYQFQTKVQKEGLTPVFRFNGWRLPKMMLLNRWLWNRLAKRLFKKYVSVFGRPDLIHAQSALWAGDSAACLADDYQIPFVVTEHYSGFVTGAIKKHHQPILSSTLKKAGALMAVSRNLAEKMQPYAPAKPIYVVPNIVPPSFFNHTPTTSIPTPTGYQFLTVSLLTPNKGVDLLLKAFAAAFKGQPHVSLHIGGDGPARSQLTRLAFQLKIEKQVQFLGMLERVNVRHAFLGADCFVLSSYFETFGLVLAEAMATGLPVISTKSGGPEEFVNNNTGMLIPKGNIQALAEALKCMYAQRSYWQSQSSVITRFADDNFSEAAVTNKMLKIFKQVLFDYSGTRREQ